MLNYLSKSKNVKNSIGLTYVKKLKILKSKYECITKIGAMSPNENDMKANKSSFIFFCT